jgi:hypothetical protein
LRLGFEVLPRLVVRVRRAVRRLKRRADVDLSELSGARNEVHWQDMLSEIEARDRAAEDRLAAAERALNRLNLH